MGGLRSEHFTAGMTDTQPHNTWLQLLTAVLQAEQLAALTQLCALLVSSGDAAAQSGTVESGIQAVSPCMSMSHSHFNSTQAQPASPRHPVTNYCKQRAVTSLAASDVIQEAGASIHADLIRLWSLIFTGKNRTCRPQGDASIPGSQELT